MVNRLLSLLPRIKLIKMRRLNNNIRRKDVKKLSPLKAA